MSSNAKRKTDSYADIMKAVQALHPQDTATLRFEKLESRRLMAGSEALNEDVAAAPFLNGALTNVMCLATLACLALAVALLKGMGVAELVYVKQKVFQQADTFASKELGQHAELLSVPASDSTIAPKAEKQDGMQEATRLTVVSTDENDPPLLLLPEKVTVQVAVDGVLHDISWDTVIDDRVLPKRPSGYKEKDLHMLKSSRPLSVKDSAGNNIFYGTNPKEILHQIERKRKEALKSY